MKLHSSLLGSLLGALLLFGGSSSPPSIPLEVEYAGCQAVLLPGPECRLKPGRQLRLWVGAPPGAQIEIKTGGKQIETAGEPVREGQLFSLTIPPETERIDVLVETESGRAVWSLSLATSESEARELGTSHDVLNEVNTTTFRAYDDIQAGRLATARERLDRLRLPPEAPAESRYLVAYHRSLLAAREGDYRSAMAEIEKAEEIAERVRMPRYQWVAEEHLALLLRTVGRSREAVELFARLRQRPYAASSCDQAVLLNNQAWSALLAREAGESFGSPADLLAEALALYETCDQATPEMRVNVLINLALAHLQEDRLAQAKVFLARAHELEPHPPLLHTLWWLDLEARIALGEKRPAEALDLFEKLEELAAETSSADGRLRATFGQARSHEALGDRAAALEILRKAETLLDEQSLQVPIHEGRETFMATRQAIVSLHVEILLDQGRTAEALTVARHARSRMLRQLERSDRLASLTPDRRARWELLLQRYQEKRAALEERAKDDWKLPADQLRQEQAARREETQKVRELLDEAFQALEDSAEPLEETLQPPRPGELILTWCPLSHGWVGFAADRETIATHRFDLPPSALLLQGELSRRLLLPFHDAIEKAQRLRILPSGPLQSVDFHALQFDGDVLLASRPVVYGLDLPVPSGPAQPSGRHALLVADPRDDLPGALGEVRTIRKALEAGPRPWITEELKSAGASAESVRNGLATADLLHYAGHGVFSGFGGWDSSMLLAEGTQLTLGDLLALERVPAVVVLSGCDTGRSSTETPVESLGLAQAFLLAGSRAVVASTRPADDRKVPAFFTALYEQLNREPDLDLAVAFQRAQLYWRQQAPGADWQGFRLFVP